MEANDQAPDHYKSSYIHWDLVIKVRMTYLEGNATKYVSRWRKKGGAQDLRKALHYLDKMVECYEVDLTGRNFPLAQIHNEVNAFAKANDLTFHEKEFVLAICTSNQISDLMHAREILIQIIDEALIESAEKEEVTTPSSPEDGGHHAL